MRKDPFDAWCDKWLGKKVAFTFLGKNLTGEVIEALDTVCAPYCIVVEIADKTKTAKILMSTRSAKIVD